MARRHSAVWYRSPWFLGSAAIGTGALVGLGALVVLMDRNAAEQIFGSLVQASEADFESRVGTTRLLFPARSWAPSRNEGLDFRTALGKIDPKAWDLIEKAAREARLSEIYFTSMYRPSGTGPHSRGRALDVGYVRRGADPLVLLLRNEGKPDLEPELAREFREALVHAGALQVLTPWWIYSKSTRNDPNNMRDPLDVDHLSHLHISVPA